MTFELFAECALALAVGFALWVLLLGVTDLLMFALS